MRKWLLPALVAVVAVVALPITGCKSSTQTSVPASAQTSPANQTGATGSGESAGQSGATAAPTKTVRVTFHLSPEAMDPVSLSPSGVAPRRGSPARHVSAVLGAAFSGAACTISAVAKGGLADKSGLKVGDRIVKCNGGEPDSFATLDAWLYCGREPGLVELAVERPTG